MSSSDPFLCHKTSWRQNFDAEHERVAQEHGADEVIFLNERGELTEGSRTNIFIERDGKLLTPPLSCGVLHGCLRQALIDEGRCVEATLGKFVERVDSSRGRSGVLDIETRPM